MYILNDKVKKRFGWGIELKAVFLFENKKNGHDLSNGIDLN